ncbi:MAG: protein kinase, partial [Lentisphaeria bacterium]|nr:protein kinase [Lentisphaeria bacterium]
MDDMDLTIPPRREHASSGADDVTMPGKRDRKPDGRFTVGDLIMKRYKVLAELGQGGMGVVYKCFDETAGIEVALKALPPELSHNTLEMEDIKDNFQLVAKLVHQNIAICKNLEKDNSNGNYYLIMECCEGEDLRRWIRRKRKEGELTLDDILPIVKQVADALDYAHEMKIIHRDIKPGNIMIDQFGKIKVLDFGLAAQIHTSMTRVSMAYYGTSGTGPYMAPEQWEGRLQDAKADQYALAVMTYEMLAGHPPFESNDAAVLREAVLKSTVPPLANVPKSAEAAILRAMSKTPAERFENCSDFAAALGGKKVKSANVQNKGNSGKWIAAILFFVMLGGIVFYLSGKEEQKPVVPPVPVVNPPEVAPAVVPAPKPVPISAPVSPLQNDEEFDSENSALKIELRDKIAEIKEKNYDPAQTFGKKIKDMNTAFAIAQEARLLKTANKEYKKAKVLADWILTNGELREDAKKLIERVKNNKNAAEKYEPQKYAADLYNFAEKTYIQAMELYNSLKFDEAKTLLAESARGFKTAEKTAFDNKLQFLNEKAKESEKNSKWCELKVWAEKIRPLNASLADQFTETADNELKKFAVEMKLKSARSSKKAGEWQKVLEHAAAALNIDSGNREAQSLKFEAEKQIKFEKLNKELSAALKAKAENNWQSVCDHAVAALNIDSGNREAQSLKQEAENHLKPTLEIIATVDGSRVPATVKFGSQSEKTYDNIFRNLQEYRHYKGSLSYQADEAEYVGDIEFNCNWRGPKKMTVALKKQEFIKIDCNGVVLEMVKIKAGTFMMGSPSGEQGRDSDEVQHRVTLTRDYWLGKFEVTQAQWQAVMGNNPSYFKSDNRPVEQVSWNDAKEFCNKLNTICA